MVMGAQQRWMSMADAIELGSVYTGLTRMGWWLCKHKREEFCTQPRESVGDVRVRKMNQ